MATVAADDTRQDANSTVSELCLKFQTAIQVFSSEEKPRIHPKSANSRRRRRRAGKNKAPVSTPVLRDANFTSTSITGYHSLLSESSAFHTALQGSPPPDQAPAVPPTDTSSASASACATQYYSASIQSMIEHRAECSDDVEYEIASSRVHWSTVDRPTARTSERRSAAQEGGGSSESSEGEEVIDERELDEDILKANRETILEQRQHHAWGRCFQEERDSLYERGEKIAEGGEAKIYAGIRTDILEGAKGRHVVFKVFPRGYHLRDLVKLWPEAAFSSGLIRGTTIEHVMLLPNDGRIAMLMRRAWGDLRRLIDIKKQASGNRGLRYYTMDVSNKMVCIAREMRWLHEDDVVHRDLKASNVLLYGSKFSSNLERYDTIRLETISDYECALGVMGTGFWRAPEVLLGMRDPKKRCSPTLFTKKSDVYSYGMLCYEIATSFLPFEREGFSGTRAEQDLVINGQRPSFPDGVGRGVKDLIRRCWHQDEDKRPTFYEIWTEFRSCSWVWASYEFVR